MKTRLVVVVVLAVLAGTWAFLRTREAPVARKETRPVTIATDLSVVAGCRMVRRVNLSGRIGTNGVAKDEADRNANLEAIAADAGGDTVLILERTPNFVRGAIYRCEDPAP